MTEIKLIVPDVPSTLNKWSRQHWGARNAERKEWSDKIAVAALSRKLRKSRPLFSGNVRVELHYWLKSKRTKNDLDNRVEKHICDALIGWVYQDDSQVTTIVKTLTRGADRDETHIRVVPASTECCE